MKIYKRNCNTCNKLYSGYGDKYCSYPCIWKGKKHTKEHNNNISLSNMGRIISEETKEKLRILNTGKKHTEETRKKISKSLLGNKYSVGRIVSQETRKILSEKGKGRRHTEETKEKMCKNLNSGKFKKGFISPMKGKKSIYSGKLHPMYGTKRSIETREKISNTRIQNQIGKGKNNGNWQGGITKLKVTIRCSLEYAKKRKKVFMRDGYMCQKCGDDTGGNLEMHHKKAFSVIFRENKLKTFEDALRCEELWNIDNCETLCHDCHKETDNYGRPKKYLKTMLK